MLSRALSDSPRYKWWVFGAVGLGSFTGVMSMGMINVALPTIAGHFETDLPTVQWVVIAQTLTVSALLLPMGRLSDMVGRKRVYIAGLLLLMVAAVLAASSTSVLMLVATRVIQGTGAAMTQGVGMAMVTSIFPEEERGKGLGTHMSVIGAGGMAGPVIGGLLVSVLGWRWVFLVNLPMAAIALIGAMLLVDSKLFFRERRGTRFDWPGAALSTAALVTFLMLMTNGYRLGWTSPLILLAAAALITLVAAFIAWELRAPAPMLDLGLFRRRVFSLGVSASFMSFLSTGSIRFIMPFYLQGVLGYNPGQVGLIMLPTAITMTIMGPIAGTPLRPLRLPRLQRRRTAHSLRRHLHHLPRIRDNSPARHNRRARRAERRNRPVRLAQLRLHILRRRGQPPRRRLRPAQPRPQLRQRHLHSRGHRRHNRRDGLRRLRPRPRQRQRPGRRPAEIIRLRHEYAVLRDGLSAGGGRGGVVLQGAGDGGDGTKTGESAGLRSNRPRAQSDARSPR